MPVQTPDVWWHLATGRWIAASGIPQGDPFSYTLAGKTWTVHEWLADVVTYGIYGGLGLLGLVWFRGALLAAAFGMSYGAARLAASAPVALCVLIPAAYASQRNWLDRPQLWSFLLAPLLLWVLESHRLRPGKRILFLPLLFILWVNLHGGFMLGLGILGLWTLGEFLPRGGEPDARRRAGRRRLGLVFCLSLLATLLNPHFFEGATLPLRYVGAGLGATLQEERAGRLDSPYAWVHLGLMLCLWLSLLLRRRQMPLAHGVLALFLSWISMPRFGDLRIPFAAERHAPLFLLLGTPLLAWQLAALLSSRSSRWGRNPWTRPAAWGVVAVASIVVAVFLLPQAPRRGDPESRLLPGRYPEAAAAWLKQHPLPGNLINPYPWGGYLEFMLYPEYKVWIDSRGDLYGPERLREVELLHWMPPGSEDAVRGLLERYDANVIVWHLLTLDYGELQVHPFAAFLLREKHWRLVFYDRADRRQPQRPAGVSAIFLREAPSNAALLSQFPPVRLPPLPRPKAPRAANGSR